MKHREAQPCAVHGQEVRVQGPKCPLVSGLEGWVVMEDLRTLGHPTPNTLSLPAYLDLTFPARPAGLPCAEAFATLTSSFLTNN